MTPADRTDTVHLRAFTEGDLAFLDCLCTEPDALGEFEWLGFSDPRARGKWRATDGHMSAESAAVAIVRADDTVIDIATWKPLVRYPRVQLTDLSTPVADLPSGQGQ